VGAAFGLGVTGYLVAPLVVQAEPHWVLTNAVIVVAAVTPALL
jgi:hypothetical protein